MRIFLGFFRGLLIKARRLSYRLSNLVVWELQKLSIIQSKNSSQKNFNLALIYFRVYQFFRPNPSGPVTPMISKMTSTPSFTSLSPTTGKTTWPSSTSPLKVNSSSAPFFSSPSAPPLIFSRTKNRKTRSNSTSDEFLSWTTATSSFLSSSTSSRVLSIRKIFL